MSVTRYFIGGELLKTCKNVYYVENSITILCIVQHIGQKYTYKIFRLNKLTKETAIT